MKKRILASLLSLVMVLSMFPTALAAEEPEQTPQTIQCAGLSSCIEDAHDPECPLYTPPIDDDRLDEGLTAAEENVFYVSEDGDDDNGNGTQEKPYKTVEKAYEMIENEGTIYLLTDLILEHQIHLKENKTVLLATAPDVQTATISPKKEGWEWGISTYGHNLLKIGMPKVQLGCKVRLENIVLDAQANDEFYLRCVDLASDSTLTLGDGATLKNGHTPVADGSVNDYGGGICVAGPAMLIMKDGSTITDCTASRGGGVYLSGSMTMESGSRIASNTSVGQIDTNPQSPTYGKRVSAQGGGIHISSMQAEVGQPFTEPSNLTIMQGAEIVNNKAVSINAFGGGIGVSGIGLYYPNSGFEAPFIININGGTISGNEAGKGGGISVYASQSYGGNIVINMTGGEISQNKATTGDNSGGGVFFGLYGVDGNHYTREFHMSGGEISNNVGGTIEQWEGTDNKPLYNGQGGGVCLSGADNAFYMTDGTISDNVTGEGGGIYIDEGTVAVLGGEITGNRAEMGMPHHPYQSTSFGQGIYQCGTLYLDGVNAVIEGDIQINSPEKDADYGTNYVVSLVNADANMHDFFLSTSSSNGLYDGRPVVVPEMLEYNNETYQVTDAETFVEHFTHEKRLVTTGTEYFDATQEGRDNVGSLVLYGYPVYFDLNVPEDAGTPTPESIVPVQVKAKGSVKIMEQVGYPHIDPTLPGYEFKGWYTNDIQATILHYINVNYEKYLKEHAQDPSKMTYDEFYQSKFDGYLEFYLNGGHTRKVDESTTVKDTTTFYGCWKMLSQPDTVEVKFLPGDHGTLSGTDSYTVPAGAVFGMGTRTVPNVKENSNYDFTGWLGSDGKTYTSDEIMKLSIIDAITFTAQYKRESSGGGGGGGTTYYILHYESNGGTEYKDERYKKNTVVELDKVPTREGYTFTGWYADEELTDRITSIKMTSDKTVYAGWEPTGVPDWLNGKDHFAYVVGYVDGTVRPLNNISRAEVATIFFRLLNEDIREKNLTTINTFADVNEGMWCNTAISTMAELGVVKGRTTEHFDPNAPITRAEFAAICARFDTSKRTGDSDFTDISGHWAEAEIERAASLGWVRGYTDGTFRPGNHITRAEAMTMINRVLNRLPEDEDDLLDGMNVWPDNKPGDWYYLAVQEATNSHDFTRKGDVHERWTKLTADPDWSRYEAR